LDGLMESLSGPLSDLLGERPEELTREEPEKNDDEEDGNEDAENFEALPTEDAMDVAVAEHHLGGGVDAGAGQRAAGKARRSQCRPSMWRELSDCTQLPASPSDEVILGI